MLSRVQALNQLFKLDSVYTNKIYSSVEAMHELQRLKTVALNDECKFMNSLISCNIRSLRLHFGDISTSSNVKTA